MEMLIAHRILHYLCPGRRPRAQVIKWVGFLFFYLCPGRRPTAQVIICVGFFFFYSCPGCRPWARVIICVGFFFWYYFTSARKWTNCAIVSMRLCGLAAFACSISQTAETKPQRREASGIFQECLL